MSAPIDPLAAQCLANEVQRYARDQTQAKTYQAQKARQRARYAEQKANREPFPLSSHDPKPWERDGKMRLFLCASVKKLLKEKAKSNRKKAKERELTGRDSAKPGIRLGYEMEGGRM
jgi:hypothetical protein